MDEVVIVDDLFTLPPEEKTPNVSMYQVYHLLTFISNNFKKSNQSNFWNLNFLGYLPPEDMW